MEVPAKFAPRPNGFAPRVTEGELYLVPVSWAHSCFHRARFVIQAPRSGIGRDYDINRLYGRLVLGMDRLWLAAFTPTANKWIRDLFAGVVITSIGKAPPDRPRKLFPEDDRSLIAHFIAGRNLESWIGDAIEKITDYGKKNGCKQIFVMLRKNWFHYAHPFYGRFERVGLARDRATKTGGNMKDGIHRPGHFRLLQKDLPPNMTHNCARHRHDQIYMDPKYANEKYAKEARHG